MELFKNFFLKMRSKKKEVMRVGKQRMDVISNGSNDE